jgi:hypothetical protein
VAKWDGTAAEWNWTSHGPTELIPALTAHSDVVAVKQHSLAGVARTCTLLPQRMIPLSACHASVCARAQGQMRTPASVPRVAGPHAMVSAVGLAQAPRRPTGREMRTRGVVRRTLLRARGWHGVRCTVWHGGVCGGAGLSMDDTAAMAITPSAAARHLCDNAAALSRDLEDLLSRASLLPTDARRDAQQGATRQLRRSAQ